MTATEREKRTAPAASYEAYPAEKARQGEIILKTKWSRLIFLTGLFGGIAIVTALMIMLTALS
jgi:hypothetical protein